MAITIRHPYSTNVEVTFDQRFRYYVHGNMDEIAEDVCEVLIKHNFTTADVCSADTGEVLMIIERS